MGTAILFAFDEGYLQPGLVAVSTALRHSPSVVPVFVASMALSDESEGRLRALDPKRVHLMDVTRQVNELGSQLPPHRHHPPIVWARVLVNDIVPETFSRVIYLDADTLTRKTLSDLLQADLHGQMFGACVDHVTKTHGQRGDTFVEIVQSPPSAAYFNSGVMVIDLEKWREAKPETRVFEIGARHHFKYSDQDALNLALWKNWYPLSHFRWNFLSMEHHGAAHAAIVHFVGSKPWNTGVSVQLFQREYEEAAGEVGWHLRLPWSRRLKRRVRWIVPTGYTDRRYNRLEHIYSWSLDE